MTVSGLFLFYAAQPCLMLTQLASFGSSEYPLGTDVSPNSSLYSFNFSKKECHLIRFFKMGRSFFFAALGALGFFCACAFGFLRMGEKEETRVALLAEMSCA